MKHILITGGTGFIGCHLCSRLIGEGNRVLCLDNCYSGTRTNIKGLEKHPNFRFVHHDISKPFITDEKIDEIYNLACPASPIAYQKDPIFTTKTCVFGAINVLELAKKNNAKILQASTSEVYGDPIESPQKETYKGNVNPIGIRSCYDEGKRCAESLFFDYHRTYNTDIRVVRIFNTYGPKMAQDDGRVVSNFICQALKGLPITIYGQGIQTRSFCYIDDTIEMLIRTMQANNFYGPINIGTPTEITIKELAIKILEKTGNKSSLVFEPLPQDDPTQRRPDITLAKQILKYEPNTSIEEGLEKTIEYFASKL